jgi:hypothetical protein
MSIARRVLAVGKLDGIFGEVECGLWRRCMSFVERLDETCGEVQHRLDLKTGRWKNNKR